MLGAHEGPMAGHVTQGEGSTFVYWTNKSEYAPFGAALAWRKSGLALPPLRKGSGLEASVPLGSCRRSTVPGGQALANCQFVPHWLGTCQIPRWGDIRPAALGSHLRCCLISVAPLIWCRNHAISVLKKNVLVPSWG